MCSTLSHVEPSSPHSFEDYLWLIPSFIGVFGVHYLRQLGSSVNKLVTQFEVHNTRIDSLEDAKEDHEERLRGLEAQ